MIWLLLLVPILYLVYKMSVAYKKRQAKVPEFNQGVNIIEDFIGPNVVNVTAPGAFSSTYCLGSGSGTGTVASVSPSTAIYYPGVASIGVAATNDTANIATPKSFTLSGSQTLDVQSRFYFDVLPTGANVSKTRFGFSDHIDPLSGETLAAAIYFDPSVSANYVCYVLSVANGLTQVVTTVPAVALTDTYVRIIITQSEVLFYIDAILVATITKVPDALTAMQVGWGRKQTSGSTATKIFVDAITIVQNLISPRTFQQLNF